MIKHLKNIFSRSNRGSENKDELNIEEQSEQKKIQIAACALFVEMANADDEFKNEEKDKIISFMQSTFNLEEDYIKELIELSKEKTEESVSIYEFTTEINKSFSNYEKYELLKNLWRLIYVDKDLDKYEERLIKKIGGIINMEHQTIIAAKLEVKAELKK